MYYGTNKNDNTPIMYNRTDTTEISQHLAIFGSGGSGRHFLIKSEIIQILKKTNDTVYILDVAGEFSEIVKLFGGRIITVTTSCVETVNPVVLPDTDRLVVLDISRLINTKRHRKEAIYMCLSAMWEKVEAANRATKKKHFWIYIDDVGTKILSPCDESPCDEIFCMMIANGRTHNCNITYSGHYISDFCNTEYGRCILENTSVITLLNQTMRDIMFLQKQQVLQEDYLQWIYNQPCGNGIICINGKNTPFKYDTNGYLDDGYRKLESEDNTNGS